MIIAVAADGQSINSEVSEHFESCTHLLIVDMDDLNFIAIKNEGDALGEELAKEVVKNNCEAVITGKINPPAFDVLAEACVTRYLGFGHSVKSALDLMDKNLLKFIRNHQGSDECEGAHHKTKQTHQNE